LNLQVTSETGKNVRVLCFIMPLFLGGVTSVPTATSPAGEWAAFVSSVFCLLSREFQLDFFIFAEIVGGFFSKSFLLSWSGCGIWKPLPPSLLLFCPVCLRFWAYEISRVGILWRLFDGSKLGIEPYSAACAAVGQQRDSHFQNV